MDVFNKNLTLIEVRQGTGRSGTFTEASSKTVRASVGVPSVSLTAKTEFIGLAVDLIAVIYRKDDSAAFNYAEISGVRYRIERRASGKKERLVELWLRRG